MVEPGHGQQRQGPSELIIKEVIEIMVVKFVVLPRRFGAGTRPSRISPGSSHKIIRLSVEDGGGREAVVATRCARYRNSGNHCSGFSRLSYVSLSELLTG